MLFRRFWRIFREKSQTVWKTPEVFGLSENVLGVDSDEMFGLDL